MTHASVFSGIGGPEVAATMLGWENLFHCEINPFGRKVLDYWYPNAKSYEDITKTDFREWRGRVNVLTGGFPCQPFSYAGQRRGAEDDRYLWPHMYRCIDQIRPDWVVAENVAGILTMVEQGTVSQVASAPTLFDTGDMVRGQFRLTETFTLERICTDLESHGYAVQPILIPACAVGAPHRRDRVFIVAHSNSARTRDNQRPTCDEGRTASEDWRESLRQGHGQTGTSGIDAASANDATADTACRGIPRFIIDGGKCNEGFVGQPLQSDEQNGEQHKQGRVAIAPDTNDRASQGSGWFGGILGEKKSKRSSDRCGNVSLRPTKGRACGERWELFPTVSPVHRGNDGIPFDVDCLAISFGKWRTEALKAYGNAIVPQVMYEIFKAIEITENGN